MNTITVGTDYKEKSYEEKNMSPEEKNKLMELLKQAWFTFHRYSFYAILSILVGIWVGVTASKLFYTAKMKESVAVGGMVFDSKVYSIVPK